MQNPSAPSTTAIPIFLRQTFSALRHRNYRIWFIGQLFSLVGVWMQITAQGYLIYELTGSSAYLGLVYFINGIPTWLFMLYAGVIGDRLSRRNLLLIAQICLMSLSFLIAVLIFTDIIQPWQILVLAFFSGIVSAFEAPSRQAFLSELVEPQDLTNGIALNGMMFNAALVVGPAAGGFAYAVMGPGWCFALNGCAFISIIVALLLIKTTKVGITQRNNSVINDLKEGFSFVKSHKMVQVMIANIGLLSLFGFGLLALMPAWAVTVLGGDETTYGFLLSFRGIGAMIGALAIAILSHKPQRGKWWTLGTIILPISILVFSQIELLFASFFVIMFLGLSIVLVANVSNAIIQTQTPDYLRGRVMSIYTLIFFGLNPLGSLLAGNLAEWMGEPPVMVGFGIILLAVALYWWIKAPQARQFE